MSKQAAILKLATKWASMRVPDYLLGELHHRAASRKYCGKRILRILEQKDGK